jgi:hypothetical protein
MRIFGLVGKYLKWRVEPSNRKTNSDMKSGEGLAKEEWVLFTARMIG